MSPSTTKQIPRIPGTLVLDSQGLSSLSQFGSGTEKYVQSSIANGRLVMMSSVTLAEVLRGTPHDTLIHRFRRGVETVAADDQICKLAGKLLNALPDSRKKDCTVDAIVVATTLLRATLPAVILTSDRKDIDALIGTSPGITTAYI